MSDLEEVQYLPYIDIQVRISQKTGEPSLTREHDAMAVFDDVEQSTVAQEDIWISAYKQGSSSVHGKAKVSMEDGGVISLKARDGVEIERVSKTNFVVSVPLLHLNRVPVKFPRQVIHPPYKPTTKIAAPLHINSLAYSSSAQKLAAAGPDGYLALLSTLPEAKVDTDTMLLKGHVGDVLDVQFFPSGQVVLSTSSDLSIRIFGLDGSNPRTLKGHTRAVTCSAILGVGKQIFSGSKDGTVRLWDVGAAKEVRKRETEGRGAVEEILLLTGKEARLLGDYEGEEWVLMALTQRGTVEIFTLTSKVREAVERIKLEVQGNLVCAALDRRRGLLATGHTSGIISLRRLADLKEGRKTMIQRNEAAIYSLAWAGDDLLVGTAAGLPCRLGVTEEDGRVKVEVNEELAGWEAVGIEAWALGSDSVWCGGGEGGIRRY